MESELPFETESLESMCELVIDCPHFTPKWTDSGVIVLRNQNIRNGVLDLSSPSFTNNEGYESRIKRAVPRAGDIVITREAPMGEVCIIPEGLKCCLGQRQVLLRPKKGVSSDYLFWALQSHYVKHQISWNEGTGTTVSNIRIPVLKAFKIPRWYKKENKIAHHLTTIADKINLNKKTNQTLEKMAQALFKSWFVDFDPVIDNALAAGINISDFPEPLQKRAELRKTVQQSVDAKKLPEGLSQETRKLFPSEFEESELGWVPKGWEHSCVGDGFNVTMGQSPPGSTYNEDDIGEPFFQGKTDFGFRYPSNRIYCTSPKRIANAGDTLVSVRAPVGAINMAYDNCIIGRGIAAVMHKSNAGSYTYYCMNDLAKCFRVFEGEGTVFGSINQKDFKALPFLDATDAVVKQFEEHVSELDNKILLNTKNLNSLTKLRDTLLPKLISGEINIPDIEK